MVAMGLVTHMHESKCDAALLSHQMIYQVSVARAQDHGQIFKNCIISIQLSIWLVGKYYGRKQFMMLI